MHKLHAVVGDFFVDLDMALAGRPAPSSPDAPEHGRRARARVRPFPRTSSDKMSVSNSIASSPISVSSSRLKTWCV